MGLHRLGWLTVALAVAGCANGVARDLGNTRTDPSFGQPPSTNDMTGTPGGGSGGAGTGGPTTGASQGQNVDDMALADAGGPDAAGHGGGDGSASSNSAGEVDGAVAPGERTGVIISEVMAYPKSGTGNEWIELFNPSDTAVDLEGCLLATGATLSGTTLIDAALTIAPAGYVLLGRDDLASESGVTPDYVYSGLYLSSDETVSLVCNDRVVSQIAFVDAQNGASFQLDARYVSAGQTATQAVWCLGTDPLPASENLGTPKAANHDCQGVPAP